MCGRKNYDRVGRRCHTVQRRNRAARGDITIRIYLFQIRYLQIKSGSGSGTNPGTDWHTAATQEHAFHADKCPGENATPCYNGTSLGFTAGDKRTNAECLRFSLCLHKDWPQTIPRPPKASNQSETATLLLG